MTTTQTGTALYGGGRDDEAPTEADVLEAAAAIAHERAVKRRRPAPYILGVVAVLLVAYYLVVALSGTLNSSTTVPISGESPVTTANYVTLAMSTADIDLTNQVVDASVLPVPHGRLVGDRAGEISQPLRIEITSANLTTSVVAVPGKSIVDPTTVSLNLDQGDARYPFDTSQANFTVSVINDSTGADVPFEVTVDNSARPWVLSGTQGAATSQDGKSVIPYAFTGGRDALTVALVLFYVLAILLTTLIAVVTIGTALMRHNLEFSNVIWLSATMLAFPALRSAMPGAPPIGTGLDYIVFFPCISLIAGMLVWTGGYLLWRESAVLRGRDDPTPDKVHDLEVLETH